jgi:hypothetical protein
MAFSKSELKAKFVTGAIPTQQDFANLIDGMLSMPMVGGTGDTTINLGKGDSSDRLYVKSLRYINNYNRSYFLIGAWDDELGGNYLVAVICFQDDAVNGSNFNITYHLLDKTERVRFESSVGDINTADEINLIQLIKGHNWHWINIIQPSNDNPKPYTIINNIRSYVIFPVLYNGIWYVGYAFGQEATKLGFTEYIYRSIGAPTVRWGTSDETIANDLENRSKFTNKELL